MSGHTPTPWRTGKTDNGRRNWVFAEGVAVADCEFLSDAVDEANADLIVRAVNSLEPLIAALESAVAAIRPSAGPDEKANAERDGKAAIALAKGGGT